MVSANSSWALLNYRLGLLKALQNAGFTVAALIPADDGVGKLQAEGIAVHPIPLAAHGTSPRGELKLLWCYVRLLRDLKPAAYLGFTIKPNIYGALAGRAAGVPVINNVTGLGVVFTKRGVLRFVVGGLYSLALRRSARIFFKIAKAATCSSRLIWRAGTRPPCCPDLVSI